MVYTEEQRRLARQYIEVSELFEDGQASEIELQNVFRRFWGTLGEQPEEQALGMVLGACDGY